MVYTVRNLLVRHVIDVIRATFGTYVRCLQSFISPVRTIRTGAASRLLKDRIMLLVFVVPFVTPTNARHSSTQPQRVSNDAIRNISGFCQLGLQITMSESDVASVTGNTTPDTPIYTVHISKPIPDVYTFLMFAGKLVVLMRSYKGPTLDAINKVQVNASW